MSDSNWERVRSIVGRSLELEGLARETYLEEACAGNPELRDEVDDLLRGADLGGDSGFLKPPMEPDLPPQGLVLGDFEILRELGRGGMGVVYLAHQASLARQVAVKVLVMRLTTTEREIARFHREARSAAKLRHPGIVQVLSEGQTENVHWFAMEYVQGHDLGTEIERQRTSSSAEATPTFLPRPGESGHAQRVAEVCASIAEALHFAHEKELVHRDVKPQNLLLQRDGRVLITDFGLVRDGTLSSLTATGELAGTPHYMSPEQARAATDSIDHRTDVYSLGVVLYELATLRRPFDTQDSAQLLTSIKRDDPPSLRQVDKNLPTNLETICTKAMAKDPQARYQSARALAEDLHRFASGDPIVAQPPSTFALLRRGVSTHRWKVIGSAALLAGVWMGSWWTLQSTRNATRAFIQVDVVDAEGAALSSELGYRTLDPISGTPGPIIQLGPLPFRGRVPAGYHRLLVTSETWGRREFTRQLGAGDEREFEFVIEPDRPDIRGMFLVPDGEITIPREQDTLCPNRDRTIAVEAFLIDECEVSIGEYDAFLSATGRPRPKAWQFFGDLSSLSDRPATGMSWYDARSYAEWSGKRLVSHPEWELAARGPEARLFPWGDLAEDGHANISGRTPTQDPERAAAVFMDSSVGVRTYERGVTPSGIHHMYGNVAEWTESLHAEHQLDGSIETRPKSRILLGAAWNVLDRQSTASLDWHAFAGPEPSFSNVRYGFRCARSVSP